MSLEQSVRRLWGRINTAIMRVIVTRATAGKMVVLQVQGIGGRPLDGVEHMQPHGLYVLTPVDAEGAVICPSANTSAAVAVCASARSAAPEVSDLQPGEGGLYYAGAFKVFMKADGTIALGEKLPGDFVALASLVNARLSSIQSKFDSHIHTTTATIGAGATPGVISPPTSPIGALASVASAKVRAS